MPYKSLNLNTQNCACKIKPKMTNYQDKCVKMFDGKRKAKFGVDKKVLVRDYKNPTKPYWVRDTVTVKREHMNVCTKDNQNHLAMQISY